MVKIKVRGKRGRGRGGVGGVISHFEYNLIIMPTPLKMSRLLWESVISMAIMSFVAHGREWEALGYSPCTDTTTPIVCKGTRVCQCVRERKR